MTDLMKRIVTSSALGLAAVAAALGAAPAGGAVGPGDQIQITPPGQVRNQQVYDITLRGFARRRSTAHLFVDYSGCSPTFAAESRRVPHASDSYSVIGSFAEVSGWKSSSPGTDHACAYLIARSGTELASARIAFPVR